MGEHAGALYHKYNLTYWQHVHMHQHIAHPPGPEPTPGIIDNISDTLLNAFSRVRKPDERFLSMRENVDKFEEGLLLSERLWSRVRSRTNGEPHFCCLPFHYVFENLRLISEMGISHLVKILLRTTMIWLLQFRVLDSWSLESLTL
jgi:hypothetical protein